MNRSRRRERATLVWLTNAPAPYRAKLWAHIGSFLDLRVMLVGGMNAEHVWAAQDQNNYIFIEPSHRTVLSVLKAEYFVVGKWESFLGAGAVIARRLLRRQVSIFYESTPHSQRYATGPVAWIRSWLFRLATSVITVGNASSKAVLDMGVSRDRIFEGVNAVDVRGFAARAAELRSSRRNSDEVATIFVGQLIPRKNPMVVLQAWLKQADDNHRLYIVGSGSELERLKGEANRSVFRDQIVFPGYLSGDDLVRLYCVSRTLVLPSDEEVWGLVVNEALACGIHVVVSRFAGVSSTFASMDGVYVCDPAVDSVHSELKRSLRDWAGPISDPEVLDYTPEALAEMALAAVRRRK